MPDINESLPEYLRNSQPAPAPPPAPQSAAQPVQQPMQPTTPAATPAQPELDLPMYMRDQPAQPPAQPSGVDSEGLAPLTDSQIKALTKPAQTAQEQEEDLPAYMKTDSPSAGGQKDQPDPNLLHRLFGKTAGDYVGYGLDALPFLIPVVGEAGLAVEGASAIGGWLAKRGALEAVNDALASHWARGATYGAAGGLIQSGTDYIKGHEFTPVFGALEGAALGGVTGAALGGVGKFLGRAKEKLGKKYASYDDLAAEAEKVSGGKSESRVPIYTSDVLPPETAAFKEVRKTADHFPIIGTARLRVKQQAAREALTSNLREKYASRNYSDNELVKDIVRKHGRVINRTDKSFSDISKMLEGKPAYSENTLTAIDQQIQHLSESSRPEDIDLAQKLQSISSDVRSDPTFENLKNLRTYLKENIRGGRVGTIPAAHDDAANRIYAGMSQDLDATVSDSLGKGAINKWKTANRKLNDHITAIDQASIGEMLNKGDLTPDIAGRLLNSADDKDRAALSTLLSGKGKKAALSGIINNSIEQSLDSNGKINVNALAEHLSAKEGSINKISDQKDKNFLNGVAKVLRHTARAQESGEGELANKIFSWASIPATLLHPLASIPGVGASIYMQMYESAPARYALTKLSKMVNPGSINKALTGLGKMMGFSGKTGEAIQQETFGASRAEPNFATHSASDATNTAGWASDAGIPANNSIVSNIQAGMTPGQMAGAGAVGAATVAAGTMPTPSTFTDQQTAMPTAPVNQAGMQGQAQMQPQYQAQMRQLPPIQEMPATQSQQLPATTPAMPSAMPSATTTTKAMTRGQRLNNPLNLRSSHHNMWKGKTADVDGFVQFKNLESGLRASVKTMKSYRKKGLTTVTGIINRWAPASENDVASYISNIQQMTRLNPNVPLRAADYPMLISAMARIESGTQVSIDKIAKLWAKTR